MILTNDAATILRELEVVHPAAKLVVMASQQQEAEVGRYYYLKPVKEANGVRRWEMELISSSYWLEKCSRWLKDYFALDYTLQKL